MVRKLGAQMTERRPRVIIEAARCAICRNSVHEIVTGFIEGRDIGLRLTGCKATFGQTWRVVKGGDSVNGRSRRYWVKRFWEDYNK